MIVYVAIVHTWGETLVRACASIEDAKHYLAHVAIDQRGWEQFYDALPHDERGNMTRDRSGMTDDEILTAWVRPDEDNLLLWGDGEYAFEIVEQRTYRRGEAA